MANKRPPMTFPELESRGRRAILRTTEEVQAEEQLLETQEAGNPEIQKSIFQESQQASKRADYTKVTYRLSPEAIDAIEQAKRELRRRHHVKATLEEIAEEAILAAYQDLLENQESSNLANKFSRKPERRKYG